LNTNIYIKQRIDRKWSNPFLEKNMDFDKLQEKIENIYARERADMGQKDVDKIAECIAISDNYKKIGLEGISKSWSPFKFMRGVVNYGKGRVMDVFISHNILHGQFDTLDDDKYYSVAWDFSGPVDTLGWKRAHNGMHHGYTNIATKDPDLAHGILRTTSDIPWHPFHLFQSFYYFFFVYPTMLGSFDDYSSGSVELHRKKILKEGNKGYCITSPSGIECSEEEFAQAKEEQKTTRATWEKENVHDIVASSDSKIRTYIGLKLAEVFANYEISITIQPTHQAEEKYPPDYFPKSKGEWYHMQMVTTRNYELDDVYKLNYYGGLNYQIEHHLFPDLPWWRYQAVSKEIQEICKEFDIPYNADKTRTQTFIRFAKEVLKYSLPDGIRKIIYKN